VYRLWSGSATVCRTYSGKCPKITIIGFQPTIIIQHRIEYKVAVLTFKSRSSATAPTYLSRHIKASVSERTLRSSGVPLLDKPFTRTDFARRAFRCSAPTVWNSLPETIISANFRQAGSRSTGKPVSRTYSLTQVAVRHHGRNGSASL